MAEIGRDLLDTLYYGDNLEILTRFISDETVDLVYLDPPFNKNAAYSLIFRDESGRTSDAQMATLEDYWHWGPTPARHYEYLTNSSEHRGAVPSAVSDLMGALHSAVRPSPLLAYLVEMTVRLIELRRVLKPSGSLYLHCDPTNSHYLKLILDAIFGKRLFRNEIIWAYRKWSIQAGQFARNHDVILFYSKGTSRHTFNQLFLPVSAGTMRRWKGEKQQAVISEGIRTATSIAGATARTPMPDWWEISIINPNAAERLGWPTQKPLALLERVIEASSKPGDVILDPFCGCGTALDAAHRLQRHWIGIDISNLAVKVIRDRMAKLAVDVPVFDWPTEMDGVRRMVEGTDGRHRFETWALTRLGLATNRRGADGGLDGRLAFTGPGGRLQTILVSVKSGHVGSPEIRELIGTMTNEKAIMGLLFTLEEPSAAAKRAALGAGFYRSPVNGKQYPKVTIHRVSELLEEGRLPDLPTHSGIQVPIWPMPAATQAVRLTSRRRQPAPEQLTPRPVRRVALPRDSEAAARQREAYAHQVAEEKEPELIRNRLVSPVVPQSRKRSRRDPLRQPPSQE